MNIRIAAAVLLIAALIVFGQCVMFSGNAAMCMHRNVVDLGLWVLHWATLAAAIWLGWETARTSKRQWLGWVAGVVILVSLNAGLTWMGFTLPSNGIDDGSENSYRR